MKIFFFVLIFIWFDLAIATTKIDFTNLLLNLKQNYENKISVVSLLSNKLTTKKNVLLKETNAVSLVKTIMNNDYNNLLNKLYPDQSILSLILKSSQQTDFKEILNNPETLIAISLAMALNDSSILYSQEPLVNSIKQLILNSLSNSNLPTNFNYTCLQDIIQQYFNYLIQNQGDQNQALNLINQSILNCYSDKILAELKNLVSAFALDLTKIIADNTSLDELMLSISKYADIAFQILINILKNQQSSSTAIPTTKTTTLTTTVPTSTSTSAPSITSTSTSTSTLTSTSSNNLINQINSIKDDIISNLLGSTKKMPPSINDLVNIII